MKLIFVIALLSTISFKCIAQNQTIPAEDIPRIKKYAKEHIMEFCEQVQKLGSDQNITQKSKDVIIENLLSFFDKDATVQVLNLKNKKNTYNISNYLNNVVASYTKRFRFVILKFQNVTFDFNHLVPVRNSNGDTLYKATYSFVQDFCVTNQNIDVETWDPKKLESYDICEQTKKTGEVIIKKGISPTVGNRWIVLLGDIQANKIDDLKDAAK